MAEENPKRVAIDCEKCGNEGKMEIYRIDVPNQPSTVISSISCETCGYADKQVDEEFDDVTGGKPIIIKGEFHDPLDLDRYMYLPAASTVAFWHKNQKFEYVSAYTNLWVLEAVMEQCMKNLSDFFDLDTESLGGSSCSASSAISCGASTQGSIGTFNDVLDQSSAQKVVKLLASIRKSGEFRVKITDKSGNARIYPRGAYVRNIPMSDLSRFNDLTVVHQLVEGLEQSNNDEIDSPYFLK